MYLKMKIKQYLTIVAAFLIMGSGCSKNDEIDYSRTKPPEIKAIMEVVKPDLNTADNVPLVCVVFAEAGLKSVKMKIVKAGVETDYKEVTTFYDNKQYSVKELPLWDETVQSFKVIATDMADRTVEKIIPISVVKYLAAPVVTFPVSEILIDENSGTIVIPRTKFSVVGASTIVKVEVTLFSASGTTPVPLDPPLGISSLTYDFDQEILYKAGDNALQVSVTDSYGKIKIETLPIRYISIPAPELKVSGSTTLNPIVTPSNTSRSLTFTAASAIGINAIRVYKLEKNVVTEITSLSKTYTSEKAVEFTAALPPFTPTTTGIRISAFDQLGRITTVDIQSVIDLSYNPNARIGSQFYSKVADPALPGVYSFYSVKDMKTYDLATFYTNRPNIDMYFYFFGGAVRLYQATTNRPGEAWSGDPGNGIPLMENWTGVPRNATKIKKFTPGSFAFNFDNVTSTDLKAAAVQTYINSAQVTADFANYVAGEVAFFQTAATSTNGAKIGMMRIESFTVDPANTTKGFYVVSFKVVQQ
jgi:nucleoside diphosphate kinase